MSNFANMKFSRIGLPGLLAVVLLLSSCDRYIFRNRMLQVGLNYPYAEFVDRDIREYKLAPNDMIVVRVFANDGFDMVNIAGMGRGGAAMGGGGAAMGGGRRGGLGGATLTLRVEFDGFVKLPVVGRVYVQGLTARQAEMLMEDFYEEFINKPFVLLDVNDQRCFLFMGDRTKVIPLGSRENITLFEVLAQAGGLPGEAKADKIKLIRGDLRNPDVYIIDLSTLKGVKDADLVLQANDIIYVEVRKRYTRELMREVGPWMSFISFAITTPLTLIAIFSRL